MAIKKVFLSSTTRDLQEYRDAVYKAIEGLDDYHCVRMEDFGARDYESDDFCRSKVNECDLFVGIVGHLYGSCPEGSEKSYTEREYDVAVEAEIPRLMFVAADAVSPPSSLREPDQIYGKLQAFRKRIYSERIRDAFETPENLSGKVRQAIHNWEGGKNKKLVKESVACVPFQVPPLPEYFVPRLENSLLIKNRLLNCVPSCSGVLVISALHGLGGIGKTVLASFLAHDKDIQRRYSDGIIWVTLGQTPDVLSHLTNWIYSFGNYEFHPTTPEAASIYLKSILHDKSVLLVIDDAWDLVSVKPFLVGGSLCQVLITTRDSLIAKAVGSACYDLDVMTEDQSLALLSARLGREFEYSDRQKAIDLIRIVGRLPLAFIGHRLREESR